MVVGEDQSVARGEAPQTDGTTSCTPGLRGSRALADGARRVRGQAGGPERPRHVPPRRLLRRRDAGVDLETSLSRVFSILFGDPFCTPTADEFGLFQATGAGCLSSEPGRQVGAALATERGEVFALGANEVPRPGGGTYMLSEGDGAGAAAIPDRREFRFRAPEQGAKLDTNDRVKRAIAEEISLELKRPERRWLRDDVPADEVLAVILSTRLGDLTEFGRAVHAEMAAILDAARNGRPIAGSVLYTTTFPCHNCARHIVGAGITRVVYVAPYAKSLADELHPDAIAVARSDPEPYKVRFEPFVGVAPRRYMELFSGQGRKNDDGTLRIWTDETARTAKPRMLDLDPVELRQNRPSYRVREVVLQRLVEELQQQSGIRVRLGPQPSARGSDGPASEGSGAQRRVDRRPRQDSQA